MHFHLRIGKRIIKTMIAVWISISIYILLLLLDRLVGIDKSKWSAPSNMYTPFFAGIAAVYAMHADRNSSFKQAKIRSLGSIIGGYFGMLITLIGEFLLINCLDLKEINYPLFTLCYYLIVSLGIIPLIIIVISVKQSTATFITCLTYLSVTISIRNGGMPVFQFATNRVLSTLVGVAVSLGVNSFSLIKRNNKILFASSIDNNFLDSNFLLSTYVKYKLNDMYYNKIPLVFMTTRTLSSLEYIFNDVNVIAPMVVMNGASLYDFQTKKYDEVCTIDIECRKIIDDTLYALGMQSFKYSIYDNNLHAYHDQLINEGEKMYYNVRLEKGNDDFVRGLVPDDINVSLYVIVDKEDKINELVNELNKNPKLNAVDLIDYEFAEKVGYKYLKINSHIATKDSLLKKIKEENKYEKLVVCASGKTDLKAIELADFSICLDKAPNYIKEKVDVVIEDNPEKLLKIFNKLHITGDFNKAKEKLIKKYEVKKCQLKK